VSARRPLWVRMGWLRLLIFLAITVGLAWAWTFAADPDANEVDPPDDMLPLYELVWLLICVLGLTGFLVSEVLVSRWRSRTFELAARESERQKGIDPYA
jgi:hypothetical protein